MPELKEPLKLTRKYMVCLTIDGNPLNIILNQMNYIYGEGIFFGQQGEYEVVLTNEAIGASVNGILTGIYDIGTSDVYTEEGGFAVYYLEDAGWCLVSTPDTSYIVPETVGGKNVDTVWIDCMKGEPAFTKAFSIGECDVEGYLDTVKITISDMNFINGIIWNVHIKNLDLTECGDNLEFSTEVLNSINNYDRCYNSICNTSSKSKISR